MHFVTNVYICRWYIYREKTGEGSPVAISEIGYDLQRKRTKFTGGFSV
jgi:hypothetical protein